MRVPATLPVVLCLAPCWAAEPTDPCPVQGELASTVCALREETGDDRDLRPDAYFFESSKVLLFPHVLEKGENAPTASQDRLAVEVEFNETIFPYQNRVSARDRHFGGLTWAFGLTPMYRVRIWREQSAPVRTPSFMPKGTFQLNYMGPRKQGLQWGQRQDRSRGFVPLTSLMATVGHHSNGQDGCLFADASGAGFPIDSCPTEPDQIRINRLNGSFSTNYLQVSVFRAYISVPQTATQYAVARKRADLWGDERRASYSFFVGGIYEWNFPRDTFGAAPEKPIRPIYGMNRFRLIGGYERYPVERRTWTQPRFKAMAWLQLTDKTSNSADCGQPGASGFATEPCAPRWGWGADVNVGLGSKVDYLGAYARFFQGQDYYNLSFTHRKQNRLQLGLSFTPGRSRGPSFPTLDGRVLKEEMKYSKEKWSEYKDYVRCNAKADEKACDAALP